MKNSMVLFSKLRFINLAGVFKFMFSDRDIIKAIAEKKIKIIPFSKKFLQPDTYKLHLDSLIAIPLGGRVDPYHTEFSEKYKKKRINEFVLGPGEFILARTIEKISISTEIAASVSGRSTLARMGVSVTQTAPVIHSGHGVPKPRKIILEISNAGPFEVVLRKGMLIGEIAFYKLNTPASKPYDSFGRYGLRKNLDELLPLKERRIKL